MEDKNEMSFVSHVIILLIVLIIMGVFFYKTFDVWMGRSDAKICRQSTELHAGAQIKGMNLVEGLKCPPNNWTIKYDDSEKIKKDIAHLMAECYWKFGAHDFELFGSDGRYCALCSYIEFNGDARRVNVDKFPEYLATEYVSTAFTKGKKIKYAEFISGEPTTPDEIEELKLEQASIDTSGEYGIIFVYAKNDHLHKVWSSAIGAGIGLIGGTLLLLAPEVTFTKAAAIGLISASAGALIGEDIGSERSADWASGVFLVPYDEGSIINLNCTDVPVEQGNK